MLKLDHTAVYGWEAAIRGMRNPLNSWSKSDSTYFEGGKPHIGPNDIDLMKRLANAGTEHGKYLRMINVTVDVTCHSVWWAEFDTYKVGTVRNSCSKMHKIHAKSFEQNDFSHEGIDECGHFTVMVFEAVLQELEHLRKKFNDTGEKKYWRAMLELLPSGYNMRATVQLNYAVLRNIYHQRKNHKLDEWHDFCHWIESLPYSELIIGG